MSLDIEIQPPRNGAQRVAVTGLGRTDLLPEHVQPVDSATYSGLCGCQRRGARAVWVAWRRVWR